MNMIIGNVVAEFWAHLQEFYKAGRSTHNAQRLDFVQNVNNRFFTSAKNSGTWPNLMTYNSDTDKGIPSVKGKYLGCCCAERAFLITARFYKYLLDNNIESDIATACASMAVPAGLYDIEYLRSAEKELSFTCQEESSSITLTVISLASSPALCPPIPSATTYRFGRHPTGMSDTYTIS